MFCDQCGKQLKDTDKFCDHCGKATAIAPKNEIFAEINDEENKQPQQPQFNQQTVQNKPQTSQLEPQPVLPQTNKLPKLYPQFKQLLKPYIKYYSKQILKFKKIIIISVVALIFIITGTIIINNLSASPEESMENLIEAAMENDVDEIIKYSTYNKNAYEELYDDAYDEDETTERLERMFDNADKREYTYELGDTEILEDNKFDRQLERYEGRFDNTDCIDSIAIVEFIVIEENEKEYDTSEYCVKIDGKWYAVLGF